MNTAGVEVVGEVDKQGPTDEAALLVTQIRLAASLGLAPIVNEASGALSELYKLAGLSQPDGFTMQTWVVAIVNREALEMRGRALWPHPIGTAVEVDHNGATGRSKTTSEPTALPNGDVLVQVEGIIGGIRVQDLRPLT